MRDQERSDFTAKYPRFSSGTGARANEEIGQPRFTW